MNLKCTDFGKRDLILFSPSAVIKVVEQVSNSSELEN